MSNTNKFFDFFNNSAEERLYRDLINETVYIYGVDAVYLRRDSDSQIDLLFGEDPTSAFTTAYPVAIYIQDVDNFTGMGNMFGKFGVEIRNQVRFLLTKDSFNSSVLQNNQSNYNLSPNAILRPREGDLLWLENFKALFEIKFADNEYFFYTFGNTKTYGWSLTCEKFRYSNERIETGVDSLQNTMDNVVAAYAFTMANTAASYSYQIGEPVFQGANANTATATATIVAWNLPTLTLTLKYIQGVFNVNNTIIGANSGAIFTLVSNNLLEQVNPNTDDNNDLAEAGEVVLNFNENNPFGEPTS
jgi:hypothetical protein